MEKLRVMPFAIDRLEPARAADMHGLLDLFARAFEAPEHYASARPSLAWQQRLLADPGFVALVARSEPGGVIVGGLVAYELRKFEQERSEFYIYDLAVAEEWRRRGIATALIQALNPIAAARGAHVIYVQADHGDDPAIALYTALGRREDVMHFDIDVTPER
jgi:aminoglycoside 3-N-acetyltransferase I